MRRFYKWPGPGQLRGEGEWREAKTADEIKQWEDWRDTGFVPTKEVGDGEDAP